ncbi:multiple epidermal growth factor-like domains protein 10 [Stegodyphus dumicola]|uniref:multiple epidermal growth factor-like domains protein 10 n=1 Tax=Stegodyphus dumicola TaxID=202533 RepID=UPI0015B2CBB5|nr:multiple epidermal growth factor-like domains protein 10 [Stegodyphus dumicola]
MPYSQWHCSNFGIFSVPCSRFDPQRSCQNGGQCEESNNFCNCLPGTTGSFCSDVTDCKQEEFCGTSNDSTCIYDRIQAKGMCQCSKSYKKFDYKEKICRVPCQEGTCDNGGLCIKGFCECLPGTTGDFCEQISACQNRSFCGYDNMALCIYDGIEKKAVCECPSPDLNYSYLTRTCHKESKGYLALFLGTTASVLLILFSVLFYLRYKKQKVIPIFPFHKLKEKLEGKV